MTSETYIELICRMLQHYLPTEILSCAYHFILHMTAGDGKEATT